MFKKNECSLFEGGQEWKVCDLAFVIAEKEVAKRSSRAPSDALNS